jgi:hypothetical protein
MAVKSPLVYVNGSLSQLPPGDTVDATPSLGAVVAGSGLVGGGDLNTGSKRLDISLSANPSGLIFVGDALGLDGSDIISSTTAFASGTAALGRATTALASGVAAQAVAAAALVSGNTALSSAVNFVRNSLSFTAASAIQKGNPVGLDDAGRVQVVLSGSPKISTFNNFIGIAQASVSSGSTVAVLIPDSTDVSQTGLAVGALYFVNPLTSGFTTASGQPTGWTGAVSWRPVAKAVSSSGLYILETI